MDAVRIPRRSRSACSLVLHLAASFVLLISLFFAGVTTGAPLPSQDLSQSSYDLFPLDLLEQWASAVVQHKPGLLDDAAIRISKWPEGSMQHLLFGLDQLRKVLDRIRVGAFQATPTSRVWVPLKVLGLDILEIQRGDASRIAKLGAMLHTDIALLANEDAPPQKVLSPRPQEAQEISPGTLLVRDGILYGSRKMVHWNYARAVLDLLHPNIPQDETVRRWYIATSSVMQESLLWGPARVHLEKAQEWFPQDADIQFLLGTLHECFASPRRQNIVLPSSLKSDAASEQYELQIAERHLQQALIVDPQFTKAHLHLGRVTALLGSYKDAVAELKRAEGAASDSQMQFYLSLFLGNGLEMTGDFDGARKQYERAAGLFPFAQSPWQALSRLAWRRADFPEAIAAMEKAITLQEVNDPWWEYLIAHVQDASSLLTAIRIEIGKLPR